ncbi:MAG TPA: DUF4129 domain-containing protein [Thermoanaerobaculia bacterium]|nr:DUF4129 domain-containing protein [Thermoanaerobaculia bacterium]
MSGRLLFPALLLAAALSSAPAAALDGPGGDDASIRAQQILKDPRYQTHLDHQPAPQDFDEGKQAGELAPRSPVHVPPVVLPVIGAGARLAQIVFIVLLVAALILFLGWLIQGLVARRRFSSPEGGTTEEAAEAAGPQAEPELEDATRLAAEGRYGEAIHALLLAAIHHFASRARTVVQPSRTSRELVRLLPLGGDSRASFNELVRAVERTLFGGEEAGREDYERSLERFRSLVRRPA